MGSLITYNSANPFAEQADPLVSKTTEYIQVGERWGTLDRISLNGVITGSSFDTIYDYQTALIASFGDDFKTLSIDGFDDFGKCKINNISFNDSDYLSNSSYSVELESYGTEGLLGLHGVINPQNSVSYSEGNDMTVSATRTIAAKGVSIPAKPDAVTNARAFVSGCGGGVPEGEWGLVQNREGGSSPNSANWVMSPFFAGTNYKNPDVPMLLISRAETFNRTTAEVSLTEEYIMDVEGDPEFNGSYILRYTEESESSEHSSDHVSINGSIRGSKYSEGGIGGAWAYYKKYKSEIGEILINESTTQDLINNSLQFSFEYDQGYNIDIIPAVNVSVSEGSDGSLISVSVNGSISAKIPSQGDDEEVYGACGKPYAAPAYKRVLRFFDDNTPSVGSALTSAWYEHAQQAYEDYKGPAGQRLHPSVDAALDGVLKLNPQPLNESVSYNEEAGVITFSYAYDDRFTDIGLGYEKPQTALASKRLSADLSISAKPMVEDISIIEGVEGFVWFDRGYHNLANLDVNINIVGRDLGSGPEGNDMGIQAIAYRFSHPLPGPLGKQSDFNTQLLSTNENHGPLERKSYSMSWDFKSEKKLTDHVDNGGAKGCYKEGTSILYV